MDSFDLLEEAAVSRVAELEAKIVEARNNYYNGQPIATDDQYDAWVDELSELKHDSPEILKIGATPVSSWEKISHTIPMGSLSKVNTMEELTQWVAAAGRDKMSLLMVTEKLDGISVAVEYIGGVFAKAATRGDGVIGEDISVNVAKMRGVLGKLPENFSGSLRGEIILTKTDHQKYFPDYSNPRNAASGVAKRYDGQGCEHLTVVFYQVADGKDFLTEADQFTWLGEMGLKTPNWYVTSMTPGIKTPLDLWLEYQQTKRAQLDYEIDGLVVRIDDLEAQILLGENDGRPKGAVAFKFAPLTKETTLRGIEWQVGATGRITPVALFDTVSLLGTKVDKASLYNIAYIKQLGLGIGSRILVARANDVIPRVVQVVGLPNNTTTTPNQCPVCSADTQMEGEYLVCTDTSSCPAQTVGRIKKYVTTLDIQELGDTLIEKLVAQGLVTSVADLYALREDNLSKIERMGARSAAKVIKNIQSKKNLPLAQLLGALSIPLCGQSTIKLATDAGFETMDSLKAAGPDKLATIPGFGPARAKQLSLWLDKKSQIVSEILSYGVTIAAKIQGTLTGKKVCFTGSTTRPRAGLEQLVKEAGGEVKNSVVKNLDYLVMADPNSTSTKAQAARKNGTKCITEDTLLEIIGGK